METTLTEAPAPKKKVVRRKKRKPYASKILKTKTKPTIELLVPSEQLPPTFPADQKLEVQVAATLPIPYTEEQLRSGQGVPTDVKTYSNAMAEIDGFIQQNRQEAQALPRTCIPVIPYWSAMWKPCADAFASNVDCVIVINVPPQKKELGFWRSAVKTIRANQEAERQSRERKGKPPINVRLVGYLSPHLDEATTRAQVRRYEQELQIREFWADARKAGETSILVCDHYGDEHTPLPPGIAQEGVLRVGYATSKTWRAEWEKARQTGRYVAMLEDVSMLMPPNWWRDWLRSQLVK